MARKKGTRISEEALDSLKRLGVPVDKRYISQHKAYVDKKEKESRLK